MIANPGLGDLLAQVAAERVRQDRKWGTNFPGRPQDKWVSILGEEFGEVCRAVLEKDHANLREELIQCAAVCLSWLEHGEFTA